MLTQAPRGTLDVLPADSYKWQAMEAVMRQVAAASGYREIRTPVFEHTELFLRGVGDTTDVVQKEMYTFLDKGERSITLKPEGTAGSVRAMIEACLYAGVLPLKMYYVYCPVYRYEAPQAGRFREHHQFGIEIFGAEQPTADAEVIAIAMRVIQKVGIGDLSASINSIGCPVCRPVYHEKLRVFLSERLPKLCPTCRDRFDRNPLRILDCKVEKCQAELVGAPNILDCLCEECDTHFTKLQAALTALDIPFAIDSRIVRGLDYYTKTVFEIVTKSETGYNLTVCGGGRYDGLVELLGGPKMAGMGFGMGMERLLILLEQRGVKLPEPRLFDVYVCALGDERRLDALKLCEGLRKAGIAAECDHTGRSLKAQFKHADKCGAAQVCIVGGDEWERGVVKVRNMADRTEIEIPVDQAVQGIQTLCKGV